MTDAQSSLATKAAAVLGGVVAHNAGSLAQEMMALLGTHGVADVERAAGELLDLIGFRITTR